MSNSKVYSTTEYNLFKKLRGNRAINEFMLEDLLKQ